VTIHIHPAEWSADSAALRAVRHQVFVVEQGVPEDLEWEAADDTALHLLAEDPTGNPIGTARLLAVSAGWR
jgi:predicted GNAT family N-acyltransferase